MLRLFQVSQPKTVQIGAVEGLIKAFQVGVIPSGVHRILKPRI